MFETRTTERRAVAVVFWNRCCSEGSSRHVGTAAAHGDRPSQDGCVSPRAGPRLWQRSPRPRRAHRERFR